jgi:hypothetical protein
MKPKRMRRPDPQVQEVEMSSFAREEEDDRLARLEQEVERLSARVRKSGQTVQSLTWLVIGGAVLCAAGLIALHEMGMLKLEGITGAVSKTVESREFGLYNRDGNRVMLCDYDKFGYPNLVFMDLEKHYRMGVKVWPEGGGTPGLVFYDSTGIRGNLRMDENNGSVLNLMGADKKGKITLAVSKDGDPTVVVTDKSGKVIFEVPQVAGAAPLTESMEQKLKGPYHGIKSESSR